MLMSEAALPPEMRIEDPARVPTTRGPPTSGLDFNRRPIWHGTPAFLDFRVGHSDATIRPIPVPMQSPDPTQPVRQAVNHDVSPGRQSELLCSGDVCRIRVGDMQG